MPHHSGSEVAMFLWCMRSTDNFSKGVDEPDCTRMDGGGGRGEGEGREGPERQILLH